VNGWTGRSSVLRELDELVAREKAKHPAGIAVITGMAGVGKTTVAVHWAHSALGAFPDGQLYLNLRGFDPLLPPLTPNEAVHGLLQGLGVAAEPSAELDAQSARYRSEMSQRRMLVILDNVADAEQVRPLLPGNADCLLVVTSRNELPGLVALGARPIRLGPLTASEAEELLAERCGSARSADEAAAIKELAALCSGLPLALSVVGARAALRPEFGLDVLGAELRDSGSRLDGLSGPDARTDVRAVLSWSYRALTPEAARVLRLLGVHPGPDVGVAAVASIAGVSPRVQLEELRRAHLIEERSPGRFVLHDLLRVYAEEQVAPEERVSVVRRIVDHYLHSALAGALKLNPSRELPHVGPATAGVVPEVVADRGQAIEWFDQEHDTLVAVVQLAEVHGLDTDTVNLAEALRYHLNRSGHWQHWHDWTTVQQSAIRSARRLGDQAAEANALLVLARAFGRLGQYEDVFAPCEASLALYRGLGDQRGEAQCHQTLSTVTDFLQQYERSLEHARDALAFAQTLGDKLGELTATHHIGVTYTHLGQYELALSHCLQALNWLEANADDDMTELAGVYDSLGLIHLRMGDSHQAADYYRRSVDIYEAEGERYFHATALARVGDALEAAGDTAGARAQRLSALAILDELLHPEADNLRALVME
jgi:tetratricopeptide (TPR) repeat protein